MAIRIRRTDASRAKAKVRQAPERPSKRRLRTCMRTCGSATTRGCSRRRAGSCSSGGSLPRSSTRKSCRRAEEFCRQQGLPVRFAEADVLRLPFADRSFDFVFSNGVLHHTRSWQTAFDEFVRVMRRSGFLFLYATGGLFWTTRRALRPLFDSIPRHYAARVLELLGMPGNRMIFMDTWYVPIEDHIARSDLEAAFDRHGIAHEK